MVRHRLVEWARPESTGQSHVAALSTPLAGRWLICAWRENVFTTRNCSGGEFLLQALVGVLDNVCWEQILQHGRSAPYEQGKHYPACRRGRRWHPDGRGPPANDVRGDLRALRGHHRSVQGAAHPARGAPRRVRAG